jgi:spectinomycin phosphotransferase
MKVEPSAIPRTALAAHLHSAYGLPITVISFTPTGEDAYAYHAMARGGEQYFVRVERGTQDDRLEDVSAMLATLRADCGMAAVVAPLRTTHGRFTSQFAQHTLAVFPFIEGTTAFNTRVSDTQWRQIAEIIAALHTSSDRCDVSTLPQEMFANPFAAPIVQALQRATSSFSPTSIEQTQVVALLREQRADLEATLQRFHRLGELARFLAPPHVPTHGDPNLANVLFDTTGTLHLIDWGELALAPRERDLTFFTGERFAAFLEAYLERTGRVLVHQELITFYLYRWVLQEIACYTSRILLESSDEQEQAHAWEELQPYLPVPHASIVVGLSAVRQALVPFVADGRIKLSTTHS